jgi:hypothetical protein
MKYPTSWQSFARDVRGKQEKLLVRLSEFEDSILVTGCQRSGGTMLSRVFTNSEGMRNYWFGKDDELDAALILSGKVHHVVQGRYCFQTTYINERWNEYFDHLSRYRMVWCLRNPYSVVYSMVYNWKTFALNELFLSCGFSHMNYEDRVRFQRFGLWRIPKIRRGAYAYAGKVSQLLSLHSRLPSEVLNVVEYDDLVKNKTRLLPLLYNRLSLQFRSSDAESISERSLGKKEKLSNTEKGEVNALCEGIFENARSLTTCKL